MEQEEYKDLTESETKETKNMFNDFCMPSISIDDIFDRSLLPSFD